MPFTEPERRAGAMTGEFIEAGDRCCKHYTNFMDMWVTEPRWTTFDNYAKRVWPDDEQRAAALALLVAYDKHVSKYEEKMCEQNGDILGTKIEINPS